MWASLHFCNDFEQVTPLSLSLLWVPKSYLKGGIKEVAKAWGDLPRVPWRVIQSSKVGADMFCQGTHCPGRAGVLLSAAREKQSANVQETCWTLWKATIKEMRDTSAWFIYSWAPKVAVWPEVLMGFFECGFRGSSGGFSPGQGCYWCGRRFSLRMKVRVCWKMPSKPLNFSKGVWREPEDYKRFPWK